MKQSPNRLTNSIIISLVLLLSCSIFKPKPVITTFTQVLNEKFPRNRYVSFSAVVIPQSVIYTSEENRKIEEKHYMLAVAGDSRYIQELTSRLREIDELNQALPDYWEAISDDNKFNEFLEKLDKITTKAGKIPIDLVETIAVEIKDFTELPIRVNWRTVYSSSSRQENQMIFDPYLVNLIQEIQSPLDIRDYFKTISEAEEILTELEQQMPPDLSRDLPNVYSFYPNVGRYNRYVERYNNELSRRRRYILEMAPGSLANIRIKLDVLLNQCKFNFTAKVIQESLLANETYKEIYQGQLPPVYVQEYTGDRKGFVQSFYTTMHYYISSFPIAAEITVNGEKKGKTPCILENITPGEYLNVHLQCAGYKPLEKKIWNVVPVIKVVDLDLVLEK